MSTKKTAPKKTGAKAKKKPGAKTKKKATGKKKVTPKKKALKKAVQEAIAKRVEGLKAVAVGEIEKIDKSLSNFDIADYTPKDLSEYIKISEHRTAKTAPFDEAEQGGPMNIKIELTNYGKKGA
jgi:hypothetical protein